MGLIARLSAIAVMAMALADPAHAQRQPDLRTSPPPNPPELMGNFRDRDFQFYSKSYALLIGQRMYANRMRLDEITEEMKNLKTALEGQHFDVSLYWDLDSKDLESVIESFVKTYGFLYDARVLIYYSGHGATRTVNNSPIGYLLPVDIPKENEGPDFINKALPLSQFVEWSTRMEVKHALFLFDSCFSGAIFRSRGDNNPNPAPQPPAYVYSDAANLPMREFITAGSALQEVPAKSVFLDLLVKVLLGQKPEADVNSDGYVTSSELGTYLKNWVPAFNPKQTPGVGRPLLPEFSTGDFIFELPKATQVIRGAPAVSVDQGLSFTPIFVAAPGDGGKAVAQAYAVERAILTTCESCRTEVQGSEMVLKLEMPTSLPENAVFDEAELSCSGKCDQMKILQPPTIDANRRTVSANFVSWAQQAIWKLRAKVLVPTQEATQAVVLDTQKNRLTNVAIDTIAVVNTRETAPPAEMQQILQNLQSEDTATRRGARIILGKSLSSADQPEVTADLIRRIPTNNYRYQIGVVEALATAPTGWFSSETVSKDILEKLRDNPKTESSLRDSAKRALQNMGSFAYYEVGDDGWLTKNGQLAPLGVTIKPLPPLRMVGPGVKLKAASAVYLRSGPRPDAPVLSLLDEGKCIRVVSRDRQISDSSGWLRVTGPNMCTNQHL
jgi:hypothetical protein